MKCNQIYFIMKNRLLLLLLLCFFFFISSDSFAQQAAIHTYTVKGVLVDSLTHEGEPYATIRIVNKNMPDKVVKMAVTGANGKFQEKMTAMPGTYLITLSSIGKTTARKEFVLTEKEKNVDLGTLYTSEATKELGGVEVVAQKPLVKVEVDKIAYNVEDDPDSKSNTVIEMLRKVPMVTVDGEDNIQVNGSSKFKIHVNGKPNNMMSANPKEVLKSMPANTIKHIEVITSPGAKYDAEGVGGVLNIVTVSGGFEGYTATVNGRVTNNGLGISRYGMIKRGKLTMAVNYNLNYHNNPRSYSESYRENYESDTEKYLISEGSNKSKGNFLYGNLEASYEIDTLRLLSVNFGMYGGKNKFPGSSQTVMYGANHQDVAYRFRTDHSGKYSWYSIDGSVDYQRVSRKNKERMLTLSYKTSMQPRGNDYYNVYLDIFPEAQREELIKRLQLTNVRSDGSTGTTEHTFQVDYTTPIAKMHTVEGGVKYIYRRNASENNLFEAVGGNEDYVYSDSRSSDYRHLNHIISAYGGYTLKYKDFSFKPGLRYEQTIQRVKYLVGPGEDFRADFSDIVPSVMLGMKVGKTQNLRLAYNLRIWRPGIWSLNPYFNNQNPMFISQGNSDLKSEKSHFFQFSYSSFGPKLNINLSLNHSFNNNGIQNVTRLITAPEGEIFDNDPTHLAPRGALYSTYANIGKSRNTGLSLYFNWNLSPKTRFYLNGYGSYNDMRSPAQGLHNYGWTGSFHSGIQHTFPLKLRASLNAGGSTPYINLQGRGSGYNYYALSLSRSFLKEDRLTLNVFCNNFLQEYRTYTNRTEGVNFLSRNSYRYPDRRFGFTIGYRMGKLQASVKKTARSITNDDVKSGGNNDGEGQR